MTSTATDQSAVRYAKDADGIVTLTLDDPTASANTMNDLYVDSMAAAVDRLYDEASPSREWSWQARRRPFSPAPTSTRWSRVGPADAPAVFELAERVKAPRCASSERSPSPSRPRSTAPRSAAGFKIALACNHLASSSTAASRSGSPRPASACSPAVAA